MRVFLSFLVSGAIILGNALGHGASIDSCRGVFKSGKVGASKSGMGFRGLVSAVCEEYHWEPTLVGTLLDDGNCTVEVFTENGLGSRLGPGGEPLVFVVHIAALGNHDIVPS